jgi:hypothetical protein
VLDHDEVAVAYDRILDRLAETYVDALNVIHRPHIPTHINTIAIRQPGIQHRHIRPQRRNPTRRLHRRPRLTHHLDITRRKQQISQATTDNLMVIEQENTDHPPFLPCPSPTHQGTKVPPVFRGR